MKKVIALSLIITILSVVPAFADTASNCNSIDLSALNSNSNISNIFNSLSNSNCNIDISQLLNNFSNQAQTTCNQNIDIESLTQTLSSLFN